MRSSRSCKPLFAWPSPIRRKEEVLLRDRGRGTSHSQHHNSSSALTALELWLMGEIERSRREVSMLAERVHTIETKFS